MVNGFLQNNLMIIKVIDPSTEEECAVISLGGVEDVNDAVSAAKKAFETWAFTSKEERLRIFRSIVYCHVQKEMGRNGSSNFS